MHGGSGGSPEVAHLQTPSSEPASAGTTLLCAREHRHACEHTTAHVHPVGVCARVCVCDRALDVRAHCVHMCAHVPSPTSVLPSQVAAPTASLSSPTPLSPEASVPLKPP